MTDLSITPANVVAGANAKTKIAAALSAITAGQVLYRDPTTLKMAPGDADGAADLRVAAGIALNSAAANQPVMFQEEGDITIGATVVPGEVYVLSGDAGGIAPVADLAGGDYTTVIGIGKSVTEITLGIFTAGVAVPA